MFLFHNFLSSAKSNREKLVKNYLTSSLFLVQLEDRCMPIVGAFTIPPPIATPADTGYQQYNGVVKVTATDSLGSGTLFRTDTSQGYSYFVLTAAHVVSDNGVLFPRIAVTFNMQRDALAVPITIPIPSDPAFVAISPAYNTEDSANNDIAILRLTDQVNSAPNHFMVQPFGANSFVTANAATPVKLGQFVNFVGYGQTGSAAPPPLGTGGAVRGTGGTKRVGANNIGTVPVGFTGNYETDFDDGTAANNTLGDSLGLGPAEAGLARGDSGGPWLARIGGQRLIVGVSRAITGTTFGSLSYGVAVNSLFAGFIQPQSTPSSPYNLTLDMNYQVYGLTNLGGVPDNLTITAQNIGGNLQLSVAGPTASLNGVYMNVPAASINSLTLRGSAFDNDTFDIIGDLGIAGNIYINGGGGNDQVVYDDSAVGGDPRSYTFGPSVQAGYTFQLSRTVAGQLAPGVFTNNIMQFTLNGSPGADTVNVNAAPASLSQGLFINTMGLDDTIAIGSPTNNGLDPVLASVMIDGGGGANKLTIDDSAGGNDPHSYSLGPSVMAGYTYQLSRVRSGQFLPGVFTNNITKFTLNGSPGADTVNVNTAPASLSQGLFINTMTLDDTITIGTPANNGLDQINAPVTVDGGAGKNTLVVDDSQGVQATGYVVQPTTITANPGQQITYTNFSDVTLRTGKAGRKSVETKGTAAGAQYHIVFQGGQNNGSCPICEVGVPKAHRLG